MADEFRRKFDSDQRSEVREPWHPIGDSGVSLRVSGGADQPIISFRDLSHRGASVLVSDPIAPGAQVALRLETVGATLEFMATVAWCREAPGAPSPQRAPGDEAKRHAIGLALRAPLSFLTMMRGYSPR